MVLAILDYLQEDILRSNDMPTAINTIKTMKEHRNSFKIDRGKRSNKKNANRVSLETPELKMQEENVLSLSFRKEMEIKQQSTGDEQWDEIYEIFKKYDRKIKDHHYRKIYTSVKV